MPSRHKRYQTEYAQHFQPLGARRPHTVKGEINRSFSCGDLRSINSTPRAGLTSAHLGNSFEPQLQRKRIVPYRKNHNIFATDTTKEIPDRVWLSFDNQNSVVSNSNDDHGHHSKSRQNSHAKKNTAAHVRESPILVAEKKMLLQPSAKKSPPYVSDGINRKSTYSRDFVNYKSNRSNNKPRKKTSPNKDTAKDSKPATSPDRFPPAGIRTATSFGDKRLLQPSDNSDYLRFTPHGNSRIFDSEYKTHYKNPTSRGKTKFKYVDGLWIEAPATLDRDTYEEVLERRNEAYSHAHRARGTHFSRENLNRYNREQAILSANQSPSSVSSMSSSKRHETSVNGTIKDKRKSKARSNETPRQIREAWSNVSEYGDSELTASISDSFSEPGEIGFLERGRSPTPELREAGKTRRHHLDVTTNLFNDSLEDSATVSRTKKKASPSKDKSRKDVAPESPKINGTKVKETSPPSNIGSGHARIKNGYTRKKNDRIKKTEAPISVSPPSSVGWGSEAGSYVPRQGRDDDVMSEAAMSSRASVASETLDRARKRRDEFWDR